MSDRGDVQGPVWRRWVLPTLGFVALVGAFLGERILWPAGTAGENSFDLRFQYFPLYEITFDALAAGRLPAWNPFHLTGVPWLATLQAGTFYPPHLLYLWLPTGVGLALNHALHLVWIAVTTAVFARRVGLAPAAAALAAILFALCGTVQWWLFWPNMLEAGAWLPLGCIGLVGLARGERLRSLCLLAAATGMSLLAGHTQVTTFLFYAWATLFFALRVGVAGGIGDSLRGAAIFAGALGLGVLVGAVQTLPTLEFIREGTRAVGGLDPEAARAVGIPSLTFVHQMIAGTRLSFGAVVLALAPAALFVRSQRRLAVWSLSLAGVTAALALGSSTGLLDVYLALPGIGWFRQPQRLLFLSQFAGAVACGIAFDGLLRRDSGPALPVGIAGLLSAVSWWRGATGAATAAAAVALVLALWWGRPRVPVLAASALLLGVAALDLMVSLPLREPLPYGARWAARYDRDTAVYERVAAWVGSDRAAWLLYRDPGAKLAERYGLRRVGGFEAFSFERQEQYFRYLQYAIPGSPAPGLFFSGGVLLPRDPAGESLVAWYQGIASRRRLLDLAATRWFVLPTRLRPHQAEAGRRFLADAKLRRHGPVGDDFTLYENPAALPRSFVTYRAAPAPDVDTLLSRLSRPDFDPLWQSYVQGDPGFEAHPGAPARGHPATIVQDDADVVEIEADLAAPGLVVLADAYGGGWRAQLDGEDATIVVTNHLFRGVRAPAGHHRVRFEYRPPGLAAGAGASLLGIAALAFLARRSVAPASRPRA